MSGEPPVAVIALLERLPGGERQSVLCALCEMHCEIACNSWQHGNQVCELLKMECPRFVDGVATCLL